MDITTLRSLTTLLSFVAFVAIVGWVYLRANKRAFDAAAQLPFLDEEASAAHRDARIGSHS